MDDYSLHEHEKLVLQVSKKGVKSYERGQSKARTGSKGVGWIKNHCMLYICVCVRHVLSANNIDLCLG